MSQARIPESQTQNTNTNSGIFETMTQEVRCWDEVEKGYRSAIGRYRCSNIDGFVEFSVWLDPNGNEYEVSLIIDGKKVGYYKSHSGVFADAVYEYFVKKLESMAYGTEPPKPPSSGIIDCYTVVSDDNYKFSTYYKCEELSFDGERVIEKTIASISFHKEYRAFKEPICTVYATIRGEFKEFKGDCDEAGRVYDEYLHEITKLLREEK